jgi:hypothetical protein
MRATSGSALVIKQHLPAKAQPAETSCKVPQSSRLEILWQLINAIVVSPSIKPATLEDPFAAVQHGASKSSPNLTVGDSDEFLVPLRPSVRGEMFHGKHGKITLIRKA